MRRFDVEKETGMFKGIEITNRVDRHHDDNTDVDINDLLTSAEFFLQERFIKHIGGEPLSLFNVFDFNRWPDNAENLVSFEDEEVDQLLALFPNRLISADEKERATEQWLDLKQYMRTQMRTKAQVSITQI